MCCVQLMDGIANAVSDSGVPQIIPDIEPQTVAGKTVIGVSVEAGKNRPYYLTRVGYPVSEDATEKFCQNIEKFRKKAAVFKGTDRAVFLNKREFTGPIYTQIEEAVDLL